MTTSKLQLIVISGEKLTISANGTFSQDVEEGATVFLQVKYGLITLIKQEADLCENLPKVRASIVQVWLD